MKVSLNWLSELTELPPNVPALVELLTLAGVEVEGVQTLGVDIPNVVVAQIQESVQHPNADRLSVCQVDDGSGAARQIVCGAKNYKVGDKVPLALPGAVLGPDFKIKVGKLRGVESQGMLCSAEELGLPKGEDGLLILNAEAQVGVPLSAVFPGDTILDLEITPNRPDLLSMAGIAREIGTLTGRPVRHPLAGVVASPVAGGPVEVQDAGLCPIYAVRRISGVKVVPSPAWLRAKLQAVGQRSINNVVDATNFVMLQLGQPLHAFDATKLSGSLEVRLALDGESLVALDGKTYQLAASHLVIADAEKPVALAGVMGGAESGVTEATTDIWLESACFQPRSIRRTSRHLGLSSDSSYRFERGVDAAGVWTAGEHAARLIIELAGGTAGEVRVRQVALPPAPVVPLRGGRVAMLLGAEIAPDRIGGILQGFGLSETPAGWQVPTFRADLTREIDLIEEIARVVGLDAIPSRVQAQFAPASSTDRAYDRAMALRRACVAQGLHEARSLSLVPAQPLGVEALQIGADSLLRVKNAMIDDQVVLRPSLLHGLFKAIGVNVRAGEKSVALFEIGRTYSAQKPEEFSHLALVLTGSTALRSWRAGQGTDADLFDLKGVLAAVLGPETEFAPEENPALALSLVVTVDGQRVGVAGQLWPKDARDLDASAPVLFAEIDLDRLASAQAKARTYREIPRFPASTRDIALLAPLDVSHERIARLLADAREPLLAGVELFDVFTDATGVKVPADKKSLAYSLTYRSPERTLTADEVNAVHAKLKERLKTELHVALRE